MAFQFSLATVLRMREIIEEREEGALHKIISGIAKVFDDLESIDAQLKQSEALRHVDARNPRLALEIHAGYGEIKRLKERRTECETELQKLEEARDLQLIAYQAARRDREMLTDMRAEKRAAYETEVAKREQSILDDHHLARRSRL